MGLLFALQVNDFICKEISVYWYLNVTEWCYIVLKVVGCLVKEALDNYNIIPQIFQVMTVCWVLSSKLIYFWRNINIFSIFYFSKSTSINIQCSSLWDTLKMMLFTKYLIKWKRIGRISWKFQYWFNLKSSIEIDIKRYNRCYTCPMPL